VLTLRLEREADGVAVAEEAVDDGEADEGDAARDAHGARVRPAGAGARGALGARRAAPPGRGAVPAAAAQERGAQLLHLRLQALRAPQDAHASAARCGTRVRIADRRLGPPAAFVVVELVRERFRGWGGCAQAAQGGGSRGG